MYNYKDPQSDDYQQQPPKPPMIPGRLILFLTIAGLAVICGVISTHSGTPAQTSTPTLEPTATPTATLYADTSIKEYVNNVLGHTLNPTDSITVSDGVVTISRAEPLSLSMEQNPIGTNNGVGQIYYKYAVTAGIEQVYYDEKAIWKAGIPGVVSVVATVSALDSNNHPTLYVKALVTADTAQSIQWDSLYPEDAWKQYDSTWQYGGTSLDWNSGTPKEQFQQFDVKWVIGQGTEP